MNIKKIIKRFRKKTPVYIPVFKSELLNNRTALITGGTRGLGLAIASAFINSGANVIITGRTQSSLDQAQTLIIETTKCSKDRIKTLILDLSLISSIKNIASEIDKYNIDILVNNAGVSDELTFESMTEEEYDFVMDTNLKGTYFLSQEVSNYMMHNNIKGNILNIASSSSLRPATLPYTLSKWGIRGFTEGLSKKLIKRGIVVNGIAPGQCATSMVINDDSLNSQRSPIERLITPQEIANMSVILVSDIGRSIVGDVVYMCGGSGVITFDDVDY